MQVRAGCAPGVADATDDLALFHMIAFLHEDLRTVQERAVKPVAMVDHQQVAFKREGMIGSEDHHAISG